MRTLLRSLVAVVIVAAGLGVARPASAHTTQTWFLATQDVTEPADNWNAVYYQRYTVTISSDGRIKGTGEYLGTTGTTAEALGVRCYTEKISGRKRSGTDSTWTATYNHSLGGYWYNFNGSIDAAGNHVGTGKNLNDRPFRISTVSEAVARSGSPCKQPTATSTNPGA